MEFPWIWTWERGSWCHRCYCKATGRQYSFFWKWHPYSNLYCVGWGVKLYSLTDPTATEFFECVGAKSSVKLFHVTSEEIQSEIASFASLKLQSVPGTMRLHQVITKSSTEFKHRHVSCFCTESRDCDCFGLASFSILTSGCTGKKAIRQVHIFHNTVIPWWWW